MAKVECGFCGLPFSVRAPEPGATYYCCSGCALASRIPMEPGNFPVSRGLVVALLCGFGLFNQVLFALLGSAVLAEGRADVGLLALRVSAVAGLGLFALGAGLTLAARRRAWSDAILVAVAAGVGGWPAWRFFAGGDVTAVWGLVAANLLLCAWLARGWARRFWGRRRRQRAET